MQSGSVPPPQATPPITTPPVVSAPTMAAGISKPHTGQLTRPANTSGAPPAASTVLPDVAPTVVTMGPVTAPLRRWLVAVPRGTAAGLRLIYVVAAPPCPPVPHGARISAPVAPSASSAPSAGGALVSPVERAASSTMAGRAGAGSSTMAQTPGFVGHRRRARYRLRAASNAPTANRGCRGTLPGPAIMGGRAAQRRHHHCWSPVAGGWIPPVRLPANVALLEPTRDAVPT